MKLKDRRLYFKGKGCRIINNNKKEAEEFQKRKKNLNFKLQLIKKTGHTSY